MQLKTRVRAVRHITMADLPEHDRRRASVAPYTKNEIFKTTYTAFIRIGAGLIVAAIGYLFTMYLQSKETARQVGIQWDQISKLRESIHKLEIEINAESKTKHEVFIELKRQLSDIRSELKTLRGLHLK